MRQDDARQDKIRHGDRVQYNTIHYTTIQDNTIQCNPIYYKTRQDNLIQCKTIPGTTSEYTTRQGKEV